MEIQVVAVDTVTNFFIFNNTLLKLYKYNDRCNIQKLSIPITTMFKLSLLKV
jgi:hypothetical protein